MLTSMLWQEAEVTLAKAVLNKLIAFFRLFLRAHCVFVHAQALLRHAAELHRGRVFEKNQGFLFIFRSEHYRQLLEA